MKKASALAILALMLRVLLVVPPAFAATAPYTNGSGSWVSPVTGTVTIELHGGGGGGGYGGTANYYGGGGGAGGQMSFSTISVTKGTSYSYSVGGAGTAGNSTTPDGGVGGDTTFNANGTTYTAKGGDYGRSYANGSAAGAGSLTGGIGDTVYQGGSGGAGSATNSGGGGGGAGTTGAGNSATGTPAITGGTAKANNGGAGGDGSTGRAVVGLNGSSYGGAGGGGTRASNGGAGAGGYILITYPDNTPPTVINNTPSDTYSTTNTTPSFTFTGTDASYLDSIEYNIQIATDNGFSSPVINAVSTTDAGFSAGHPFASGNTVTYTVQSPLSAGTYYWHVRGIDPGGTNTYGAWSSTWSFTVTGLLDHYLVTAASPQTAGVCSTGTNTITAKDSTNATVGTDTSTVNITNSGTGVTFYTASDCQTTTTSYTLSSGVANIYYKTNRAQNFTITATKNLSTETGTSGSITVNPGPQSRLVITLPGETFTAGSGNTGTAAHQTVGVQFALVSITATDGYFNVISGYSGTKTLSYSGPTGSPSYTTSVNFSGGISTTALNTTLTNVETTSLTVTDTSQYGYASSSLTVDAAPTPTPTPAQSNILFKGGINIRGGTKVH